MEEQVGALWHSWITRVATTQFPEAAVTLSEVERSVTIVFRALGGDGGLRVVSAEALNNPARRGWLQRLAGSQTHLALAWRDSDYLRLPPRLDWLPERTLNRDLYLWLAALAVVADHRQQDLIAVQSQVQTTLARFPGMAKRYRRLVTAHLATRPDPTRLPPAEAETERRLRRALLEPGSVEELPTTRRSPAAVPLWLHPQPPRAIAAAPGADPPQPDADQQRRQRRIAALRRQAERVRAAQADRGLVALRMENIFSWGEFVAVDRASEDEEDPERAEDIARDLDRLAVSRDVRSATTTLRFDLDLPAEAEDDQILGEGMTIPEWDWKRQRMEPDRCRILPLLAANAPPRALPEALRVTARRLRAQFQALTPERIWLRGQTDGQEIDTDAWLRFLADRANGQASQGDRLYRQLRRGARDLACLLLADLSLSTDTWINDRHRVIDLIRDSLLLFAEALDASGDPFAIHGFSSRRRDPIRVHSLKDFGETYTDGVRGRIQAIKPGYYTRMGAAIRYASLRLQTQSAARRLLLILTDGKPNDLDQYEGRFGLEDTRHAVLEARQAGLEPFCVTIDSEASAYLPYLFGQAGYLVIRRPEDLPKRLPQLYARLTA